MDGNRLPHAGAPSWASVVRDGTQRQAEQPTQPSSDSATQPSRQQQQSTHTSGFGFFNNVSASEQHNSQPQSANTRASNTGYLTELRSAPQQQRLRSIKFGAGNSSILSDPLADDPNPFAGFPESFLANKAAYSIKSNAGGALADQSTPHRLEAMPSFGAVFHLSRTLADTLYETPTTALRETLGLAQGEYLVIPLDKALADINSETVTKAKFSVQHLQTMSENTQYPVRFSLGGQVMTPGVSAHQLAARQTARDNLNGFWMTFTYYADAANLSDKTEFVQSKMAPLLEKYLHDEDNPDQQSALGNVARFFSAVFQTADFNDSDQKPILLQQLVDIYDAAIKDDYLLESLATEASENMGNCADRRALVLGDMEMMVLMHQCAKGMSSADLFSAGLRLMRTHIADEHAFQSANDCKEDETIEVLLRFRVALAHLGLAVSAQRMAHEAVAQVQENEIDRASHAIKTATRDLSQVQQFFRHCTPWMSHVDALGSPALTALSERAQTAMADLYANRQNMPQQEYVQACDDLMARWQLDKDAELIKASDALVTQLHGAYWQAIEPQPSHELV